MIPRSSSSFALVAVLVSVLPSLARADETIPKPPPSNYSLPWSLRPAIAATVARADAAFAFQDTATTIASTYSLSVKLLPDFAVFGRIAHVYNAPDASRQSDALGNPLLGALYTPEIAPHLRLVLCLGATIPIGMGGGNDGDAASYKAINAGVYARSAMDNALFAVNYFAPNAAVGAAYIRNALTVQGEVSLAELIRVRGESVEKDDARTNAMFGVHAGYALVDWLIVSAELRYQRWLSTPAAVNKDPSKRDQATAGLGARFVVPLAPGIVARPGIAYFHPLDDPMSAAGYRIVVADVPVTF
jgi:hypothetical protein